MILRKSPLTEAELLRVTRNARRVLTPLFLRDPKQKEDIIDFQLPKTKFSKGEGRLVIPIGAAKVGAVKRPFVAKLRAIRKPHPLGSGFSKVYSNTLSAVEEEVKADFLRNRGFPIPVHHVIGEIIQEFYAIASEDLSHEGKLEEAHGFDFSKLKNGDKLKKQLEKYIRSLHELEKRGILEEERHITDDDPDLAFRKTFLIQHNAMTREGKLIMADLDHIHMIPFDSMFGLTCAEARKKDFMRGIYKPEVEETLRNYPELKDTLRKTREIVTNLHLQRKRFNRPA